MSKNRQRFLLTVFLILALTTWIAGCGAQAPPSEPLKTSGESKTSGETKPTPEQPKAKQPVTIRAASAAPVAGHWPIVAAMEKGFFKDEGIIFEISAVGTEAKSVQAVVAGAVETATPTAFPIIRAIDEGGDLVIVAAAQNKAAYTLVARPEIKDLKSLKGKVIGTDNPGPSVITMITAKILKDLAGMKTPGDYDLIGTGAIADRYAALTKGAVSATLIGPPWDARGQKEGMNLLADTISNMNVQWHGIFFKKDYLAKNEQAVVGFIRAIRRGTEWVSSPANQDEAVKMMMKYLNQPEDIIRSNYKLLVQEGKVFTTDGGPDLNGLQNVIDMLKEAGQLKKVSNVKDVYDSKYVEKAKQ